MTQLLYIINTKVAGDTWRQGIRSCGIDLIIVWNLSAPKNLHSLIYMRVWISNHVSYLSGMQ